jgi:hypothetical protein
MASAVAVLADIVDFLEPFPTARWMPCPRGHTGSGHLGSRVLQPADEVCIVADVAKLGHSTMAAAAAAEPFG